MKVLSLQNLDLFMVDCQVTDDEVIPTMMWANPEKVEALKGQTVEIVETKNPDGFRGLVTLPADLEPLYTYARLKRVTTPMEG